MLEFAVYLQRHYASSQESKKRQDLSHLFTYTTQLFRSRVRDLFSNIMDEPEEHHSQHQNLPRQPWYKEPIAALAAKGRGGVSYGYVLVNPDKVVDK